MGGPTADAGQSHLSVSTIVRPTNLAADVLTEMRDRFIRNVSDGPGENRDFIGTPNIIQELMRLINPDAVLPEFAAREVLEILKDLAHRHAPTGEHVPHKQLQKSLDLLGVATYINSLR